MLINCKDLSHSIQVLTHSIYFIAFTNQFQFENQNYPNLIRNEDLQPLVLARVFKCENLHTV